ncbi:helix-turn-helix transcriptional regulator [Staphylococcus hyicus]|uniref:helix-turn-helix transcriptional regulator n=1 Tax=Staphylococcus hyicus TaxID=1284 RepID=UPI0036D3A29D
MTINISSSNFKKAMFLKGYNLSDLSRATGISVTYLSQIINNRKTPSPKLAKNIASTLDVEIEDIFEFEVKEA